MACGDLRLAPETYWTTCTFHWNYPCGVRMCPVTIIYPCGIRYCTFTFRYPCGIRWCRRWGIRYPCGVRMCTAGVTYPCGLNYCTTTWRYPCGFRYCRGTGYYPCRKHYETMKYCYDFSTVKETCVALVARIVGCCDGNEYSTTQACLGLESSTHADKTLCFYSKLESSGSCTSASLPSGAPGEPLDPGSVAPHGAVRASATRRIGRHLRAKLGTCGRCMINAAALCLFSWLLLAGALGRTGGALQWLALVPCVGFSALLGAHLVALGVRRSFKNGENCNCGGSR
jgi:hypothetical protein